MFCRADLRIGHYGQSRASCLIEHRLVEHEFSNNLSVQAVQCRQQCLQQYTPFITLGTVNIGLDVPLS